jgi:4-hydroxy-tetrahydrodipicolinate reductase
MKIALLGYGKMGHEVERMAIAFGHSISLTIDNENDWIEKAGFLTDCDVAIEFSVPANVENNIYRCIQNKIPVVIGTTGWYSKLEQITDYCNLNNGSLFYATNYSIGVNIFFAINQKLASLFEGYPMYSPSMIEIHHTQKIDSPSGTAITLANGIIASDKHFTAYSEDTTDKGKIPIESIREGNVTGTHTVNWNSDIDKISITHEAYNREGFALGAVMAAAWLHGRKGVFSMNDMLKL